MLSTKGIVSLIGINTAVKSHSCPSWRFQRLSLVGQLGFLDSGIVAVEESQLFSDFSADSVHVPLHQS